MDFEDLKRICDKFCNVIMYKDIENLDDILGGSSNGCIVLVLWTANQGHYITFWKDEYNNKIIHFFDPFGRKEYFGNQKIGFSNKVRTISQINKEEEQYDNIIFNAFLRSSFDEIQFNDYKIQKDSSNLCSIWCILRLLYRKMNDKEFKDFFKGNDDEVIKFGNYLVKSKIFK